MVNRVLTAPGLGVIVNNADVVTSVAALTETEMAESAEKTSITIKTIVNTFAMFIPFTRLRELAYRFY